jgi:cytochrome c-type biogenesis protein CcmH
MSALFLLAAAAVAILALSAIGSPLLKVRQGATRAKAGHLLSERLDAIRRDRECGLIGEEAAAEAEIEAKRAVLAAGDPPPATTAPARRLRLAAIAFLAASPLLVVGLYVSVGAPSLIEPSVATVAADIAALPDNERRAMIDSMVEGLAARLEENPDDAEGLRMLARSQMVLERPAEAAESFRRLLAVEAGDLDDWRNYATALAARAPDQQFPVDEEFLRALVEIEKRAPDDLMALFYRGGAARRAGDAAGAAAIWGRLLDAMPPDAPVRSTLEELIAEADGAALSKSVPK